MELEARLPIYLFFMLLLLSSLLLLLQIKRKDNLPPGPRGWPILGNIFQLGAKPHATLTSLANIYGPLFSLRLGTQRIIVASSPSAAALILKTHQRSISSRPNDLQVLQYGGYLPYSILWSDCTETWKQMRTICRNQLFSGKMIDGSASLRRQKVEGMVRYLRSNNGKEVCISDVVYNTVISVLAATILSDQAESMTDHIDNLKRVTSRLLELFTTPNLSDYFPKIAWFDIQGLRRESMACFQELYDIWDDIIVERKKHRMDGDGRLHDDFLDVLLSHGFNNSQTKACLSELFAAGSDTTTITIEWAMAEFTRRPEIMVKLRKELSDGLSNGTEDPNLEKKLKELPYFQACIKETLRLHPPVPLLIHSTTETCEGFGYTIPKGCQVWVNVWATGRDPTSWPEPLTFRPDRFVYSPNLDFRGSDYQLIPFGSGMRMCPGLPLATRLFELMLANLVHNFEWSLPEGMESSHLNMEEKNAGATIPKKVPLQIIPKFTGYC